MNTITFTNRYGEVVLKPVTAYMPVSMISSKMLPPGVTFSMVTAEQIALITGNKMIQIAFVPDNLRVAYIIHHIGTSVAAVCEIERLTYSFNGVPYEEIARLGKLVSTDQMPAWWMKGVEIKLKSNQPI